MMQIKQSHFVFNWLMSRAFFALILFATATTRAICAELDTRADFLKVIDRPRVPLAPEVKAATANDKVLEYRFTFATEENQRVPGILVKPAVEKNGTN